MDGKKLRLENHWVLTAGFLMAASSAFGAAKVTGIDFKGNSDPSQIEIKTDSPVTFEKQDNAEDRQLLIELKGATLSKSIARKIDTSSFKGNVNLISPYQVDGQDNVRVVVQMRKPGSGDVSQNGNTIRISVPMGSAVESAPQAAEVAPPPPGDPGSPPADPANPPADSASSTPPPPAPDKSVSKEVATDRPPPAVTAGPGKGKVDRFMDSRAVQRFTGKSVTLQARDVEVGDVFRLIADASGFNIVLADDVKGKITLSLVDVPWDQALDLVLHTMHLGAERNNNILRISTLDAIRKEKTEELATAQAAQAASPRVTRIFPISYGSIQDLKTAVEKIAEQPDKGGFLTKPLVLIDSRSNSLIVQDYEGSMEKIKKLIEILDTATPQVMIEGKVIEATETFSKKLQGGLGLGFNNFGVSVNGVNPFADAVSGGTSSVGLPSAGVADAGILGTVPKISFIPGMNRLNALFRWGESESLIKVVANPKTVVMNGQKSSVLQETAYLQPTVQPAAFGGFVQTFTAATAQLKLEATPTVNNDGNVLMKLALTREVVQPLPQNLNGKAARTIDTLVMVDSGTTLVIGGVYNSAEASDSSGFPFLSKIPIIGALFGAQNSSTEKTELFFFITPKILNAKEAGLSG